MDLLKKNWKTVLIAILAILAVVFGILFIDGNSAKNDADKQLQDLKASSKKELQAAQDAANDAVTKAQEEAEEAAAKAKEDADAALTAAVDAAKKEAEDAAAKAKEDADAALTAAVDAAKKEAEEAQVAAVKDAVEATMKEAEDAAAKAKEDADAALTAAVDAAKKEAEDAAAKAKENADAELKAAVAKAEADAQVKIDELNVKLKDTEKLLQDAQSALEGENADKAKAIEDAKKEAEAAATKAKETADAAVTAAVEAAKAEAATAQEEAVKAAKEEGAAALKEAQAQIADLESKVASLEEQLKAAGTAEKGTDNKPEEAKTMTHEEFAAAALESEVCVDTFVQATQAWWDNKITVYAQSADGAYFIYNMTCAQEDAAKLVPGTPIRVKGYKAEWSGETEIVDATFEIIEGDPFIAEPKDVTEKLGTDDLIKSQNELVAFKGLTVEAYDESGAAFAYKNAENKTDDLYFKVSKDGKTYDFCVEFYLCGQDTEVYKAVEALQVGDVIDAEGFLYWYNGANPHITKVTKAQ